jgi:transcriptional regulator with XRE-family HTH domain
VTSKTQPQLQPQLPSPVMKVVLGLELARLRNLTDVTQDQAAERLRCTQQKIACIENGIGIKEMELEVLLDLYEVEDSDKEYARYLQTGSRLRTRRGAFSTKFDPHMKLLVDMEPSCRRYFSYQALVVPGLLQTEQYMRRNAEARRPSFTLAEIDQLTDNRLRRQRVLDNPNQQFWFIIDEAALRRTEGGPLMKAQITHLLAAVARPNVVLQIVPFNIGYYMGQGNEYTIFDFDTNPSTEIIYLERHEGGDYMDNANRIAPYLTLREHHLAVASGPEQSRRLLLNIASSL